MILFHSAAKNAVLFKRCCRRVTAFGALIALLLLALPFGVCADGGGMPALINKNNKLAADFIPENLKDISGEVSSDKPVMLLEQTVADAFIQMYNQMRSEGLALKAVSGYRDFEYQNGLFDDRLKDYRNSGYGYDEAYRLTNRYIAPPGESEHQAGLAVDVGTTGDLSASFDSTKEGRWIAENSHNYGFVIRYGADKEDITGIAYEPWHIRYVGLPHSRIMYENNMCLEEYLEFASAASEAEAVAEADEATAKEVGTAFKMPDVAGGISAAVEQIKLAAHAASDFVKESARHVGGLGLQTLTTLLWAVNTVFIFTLAVLGLKKAKG